MYMPKPLLSAADAPCWLCTNIAWVCCAISIDLLQLLLRLRSCAAVAHCRSMLAAAAGTAVQQFVNTGKQFTVPVVWRASSPQIHAISV